MAPRLLSAIAKKHNRLVNTLSRIQGTDGITVKASEGNILIGIDATQVSSGTATELHFNNGTVTIDIDGNGINITRAGNSLVIDPTLITHNMTVRAINVCNSGSPGQMLVVGSAPY